MRKYTPYLVTLLALITTCSVALAGNKIKVYFDTPVDTSVSIYGVKAVYLNNSFADTICAYINRAKYSVDIAQYDYNQSSYFANIATAANNAYSRGVNVRWLSDATEPNSGLSSLNANIPVFGRPANVGGGGIMHNKFIIIDANSTNPADAILCTGSEDWDNNQLNLDYNNILFIQDSALAHAYTAEFNMMWGSSTLTPNASSAKFGNDKTDLGLHTFYVAGTYIELYFSPSDHTNNHIINEINTATKDLYFGVYCFTENENASAIVAKYNNGINTAGIVDQYTTQTSPSVIATLNMLGASRFKIYSSNNYLIYHSKMLIVDPSGSCGNPSVLTGSHNWTYSADTYNDENTLIIHNDTIANVYYQAFHGNFVSLGGALSSVGCTTTGILEIPGQGAISVYPNPATENVTISYSISTPQKVAVIIYNAIGQQVYVPVNGEMQSEGKYTYSFSPLTQGVYVAKFMIGNNICTKRFVKL